MSDAEGINRLRADISARGIHRVPAGSRELPGLGGTTFYRWQFYLRAPLLRAEALHVVGRDFWARNAEDFQRAPFQLAAIETAGVPVLVGILMVGAELGLVPNAITIRKQRKGYGRQNIIEGRPSEAPVMLIDDLSSPTHAAMWHGIQVLHEARLPLHGNAYVVVSKQGDRNVRIATSMGMITLQSLFTLADFGLLEPSPARPGPVQLAVPGGGAGE